MFNVSLPIMPESVILFSLSNEETFANKVSLSLWDIAEWF